MTTNSSTKVNAGRLTPIARTSMLRESRLPPGPPLGNRRDRARSLDRLPPLHDAPVCAGTTSYKICVTSVMGVAFKYRANAQDYTTARREMPVAPEHGLDLLRFRLLLFETLISQITWFDGTSRRKSSGR